MGNTLIESGLSRSTSNISRSEVSRENQGNQIIQIAFNDSGEKFEKQEVEEKDPKIKLKKILTQASEKEVPANLLKLIDEGFKDISDGIINRIVNEEKNKANPSRLDILKKYTKEEVSAIESILSDMQKIIDKLAKNNENRDIELGLMTRFQHYSGLKKIFSQAKDYKDIEDGSNKITEQIGPVFVKRNALNRRIQQIQDQLNTAQGKEKVDLEKELLKTRLELNYSRGELEGLKSAGVVIGVEVLELKAPPPKPKVAPQTCE